MLHRPERLALAAAIVLLGAAPSPQTTIVAPDDGVVDGSFLQPYSSAWHYSHQTATGEAEALGIWSDELRIVEAGGEEQIVRRQRFPSGAGYQVLTNRARKRDLAPRSLEIANDAGTVLQRVEFGATELRVEMAGQMEPLHLPLAEPVFDWFQYGILLASFPLEAGYETRFAALDNGLQPTARHLKVVGRETIAGVDGEGRECWVVETDEDLTFWITDEAPYILQARKDLPDGSWNQWDLRRDAGHSNYVELRVYRTQPDARDRFLAYFEEHYLESQEETGMRIWGQFRDLHADENFVWIRGYRTMPERVDGLTRFYTSALWQETGGQVREMLAGPARHVHLLEPLSPVDGLPDDLSRPDGTQATGVVVAQVFELPADEQAAIRHLRDRAIPAYAAAGGVSLGLFRSSEEPDNFPALPFLDERVLVWLASFSSAADYAAARDAVGPTLEPFETFVLEPGERSRLYHRGR